MPQVKSPLFLAALSGIIVYSYNSILEPLVFGNDDITEAQVVNSNELELRRNLASRNLKQTDIDRILEVTQDNFPECMGCTETSNGGKECAEIKAKDGGGYMTHPTYEHMTVYECLDFIEQFIYENYTEEDRYVRAVVRGERSPADFWAHSVVIDVGDNDIAIGRDDDGMVHFDLSVPILCVCVCVLHVPFYIHSLWSLIKPLYTLQLYTVIGLAAVKRSLQSKRVKSPQSIVLRLMKDMHKQPLLYLMRQFMPQWVLGLL